MRRPIQGQSEQIMIIIHVIKREAIDMLKGMMPLKQSPFYLGKVIEKLGK